MQPSSAELEDFFNILCDAAAAETLPRFRAATPIDNKLDHDFDPVTEGDRQAERAIRNLITSRYPNSGIVGEEFGNVRTDAEFKWIIDPIDGTRAFISGLPVWGTLIGLYRNGAPYAGAMDQPFTRERFLALPDENGTCTTSISIDKAEPEKLATRRTQKLEDATLMTTSPHLLKENDERPRYDALERRVNMARYGCDCYAYSMVAAGQIDLVVESGLNIYDIAALIPIIEGAGGIVTDWHGNDASQGGQILAAANANLHQQAMETLRG